MAHIVEGSVFSHSIRASKSRTCSWCEQIPDLSEDLSATCHGLVCDLPRTWSVTCREHVHDLLALVEWYLYRSFRLQFLQARWPNQRRQSTEGRQLVVEGRLQSHRDHSTEQRVTMNRLKATTSEHEGPSMTKPNLVAHHVILCGQRWSR